LFDRGGEVLWKESGVFSSEKAAALEKKLQEYLPISDQINV
jgi:hypothetical protein